MHNGIIKARQLAVFLLFIGVLLYLLIHLFSIQAIDYDFFSDIAKDQHTVSIELEPKRGSIFDRQMRILAVNLNVDSVFANPREVFRKEHASKVLASILKLDEGVILDRLKRDKGFVWIKRKISRHESEAIKKLKIKGIELIKESKRFYPNSSLGCHFLGVADIDNNGLEGLELYYNKYLKGSIGWRTSIQDAKRRKIVSFLDEHVPPQNGYNLILTIDEVIQHIAERELKACFKKYKAKDASIIVMDPRNGAILAMANLPNYDLNDFKDALRDSMRNRAICDFFEPGSVFKVVAASAALEEGVIDFPDKVYCEDGAYRVGRRVLHDHRPHGVLTFREVIEKSSNIGTVKVASRFGASKMYKYIKGFGFCDATAIDLPGEVAGMNRDVSRWTKGSMLAIPMGQEVTTTALQLACAISSIINGGRLFKPRIVKEIIDERGETIKSFSPKIIRRVISPESSSKMRELLTGVVDNGTGRRARIEGYKVGGKTGTAQKVEDAGFYSHSKFRASFIGFAPAEDPILAVVVCIDEPRPIYYGGVVAAPVFKKVIEDSLKYLNSRGASS